MRLKKYLIHLFIHTFLGVIFCLAADRVLADTPIPDNNVTAADMLSYQVPEFAPLNGSVRHVIPIIIPPGRNGIQPELVLTYDNSLKNGPLGIGWKLQLGEIRRQTKWGVQYDKDDYIAEIDGTSVELVKISANEYRAKIEGDFNRYFNRGSTGWEVIKRDGTRYFFGRSSASRNVVIAPLNGFTGFS